MRVIELPRKSAVLSVMFSACGQYLAVSQAGTVLVLSPHADAPLHTLEPSHLGGYARSYWRIASALPDGRFLIRSGFRILRLDPRDGSYSAVPLEHPPNQRLHTFGVSADGRHAVASVGLRGEGFRYWPLGLAERAVPGWEFPEMSGVVRPVVGFSHGGEWFAAAGRRRPFTSGQPGGLAVHSLRTGEQRHLVPSPTSDPKRVLFTPDDEHLMVFAVASFNLYPVSAPRRPVARVVNPGLRKISGVAVHPSGRQVATVSYNGLSRVYDLPGLREVNCFGWNVGPMLGVAFSPDGLLCAAVGVGGRVVIWDCDG